MQKRIEKVAVLGAGTMGSRIAAHLANAGVRSYLLDIVPADAGPTPAERNRIADGSLEALRKAKPAAFMDASLAGLVTTGNFEDDLGVVANCDWIIEVVVENLEIKRSLLRKVEAVRRPGTIITTNTSGLPISAIAEGFSAEFRRHWFGTHFFNPPRYMRLMELIATPDTDPELVKFIDQFCTVRLGKGVVYAKDTPNFIGNRIGSFMIQNTFKLMQQFDLTVEDVDALTGSVIGLPRSATFRTTDMVGLDIMSNVARNAKKMAAARGAAGQGSARLDERDDLDLPKFVDVMLERKLLGDKTKAGFYKKDRGEDGSKLKLTIDWKTLEYRPSVKAHFDVLDDANGCESLAERLRIVTGFGPDGIKQDKGSEYLWTLLSECFTYAANRIPEISDNVVEIDRAMRLGYNWEIGPFEMWDAIGVPATVERMKREGRPVPANVEKLLAKGFKSWYGDAPKTASGRSYFDFATGKMIEEKVPAGYGNVSLAKKSNGVVKENAEISLVDLGDGVGCFEFHTKMNALGAGICELISETLGRDGVGDQFDAFVIHNDAPMAFSAGANIMEMMLAITDGLWKELDQAVRGFQGMTQAIKFSPKPVVAAPFGLALGGGCEVCLHAAARRPHAELYMGLVEVGVGLLPGGGGCKEIALRAIDSAAKNPRADSVELVNAMTNALQTIAMAKVSMSAMEARGLGFLTKDDEITFNRERVLYDAKARALQMARSGYRAPVSRTDIPAPGENILGTLKVGLFMMREAEYISDHDLKIASKIAEVICGGAVTPGTLVTEQYLLDLEREAFLSLCGEQKTQERIQYMLMKNKPLRN
jgi:3-hydroxyacyl-CoA dehydrogenase